MTVKTILRKKDMILENEDLEPLYTMRQFPIYMGVTDDSREHDMFADEVWKISKGSGMIQLEELVPTEILYKKSHNSSIGKVWKRHHESFSRFLHENMGGGRGILEIGGGNGILNVVFHQVFVAAPWTIVEPSNVEALPGCSGEYIKEFWKSPFPFERISGTYDTLVHSHLMEHQFELNEFMELNASALHEGEAMVFSVPNMMELLMRKYPYALNFEHTYFISEDYIDRILEKYGFEVKRKEYFEDHSIFYCAVKRAEREAGVTVNPFQDAAEMKRLYDKNKRLFCEYVEYYRDKVKKLNDQIFSYRGDIYLFGAHINTQLLINFGLNTDRIKAVLDNDVLKQTHRMYGTDLMVLSPKVLADEERPLVICMMGAYTSEIEEDILENINETVCFAE